MAQTHSHMHLPGIEPRSHRWRRCIPPLDHRRLNIEETAEHCASRRDPFTIWLNLICKVRCTSAGEAFCLKTETSSRLIHFRPAPAALAPWGSAPGQLQTIAGLASGGRIAFWASLVRELSKNTQSTRHGKSRPHFALCADGASSAEFVEIHATCEYCTKPLSTIGCLV